MSQTTFDDRKEDRTLHSRLFVVCSKQTKEHDLRKLFEEHGTVDDVFLPRDRNTGDLKGFAYIKYAKTSHAAAAIKALHLKYIDGKPIKVMVATNKNDPQGSDQYGEKYTRLFIKVPKESSDLELKEYFNKFGYVQSVFILKDKDSGAPKGFAYVKYGEFYDAAKAYEECDKSFRPIFATPKQLKRSAQEDDTYQQHNKKRLKNNVNETYIHDNFIETNGDDYRSIIITCFPIVHEKYISNLCNIIPGLQNCQYTLDTYNSLCKAEVTYSEPKYAAYAVSKLNDYEFPSGEIITAKPDKNPLAQAATNLKDIVKNFKNSVESGADLISLADAIEKASSLIKAAAKGQSDAEERLSYCNIPLPSIKPKSNTSKVAQRLFIICKPQPPPLAVLQDAFTRFGDFISVSTIPNKTFGFVKYASTESAQQAMKILNGATLCGMRLKVVEADEKPPCSDEKNHIEGSNFEDKSKNKTP